MAPANTQAIGKALIVYGTVKAVAANGTERLLGPNSPIYAHERIVTGADGSVSIHFAKGGDPLAVGRMSDVAVDEDVYGGGQGTAPDAVAQVEDIQAALQSGMDPTTDLPAPAAGGGAAVAAGAGARGGGRQIVVVDADQLEVLPDSGAETRGIALNFLDPPPWGETDDTALAPDSPTLDLLPQAITVEEDALRTEFGDPDTDLTQGYPADVVNPTDIETIDLTTLVEVDFGGTAIGTLSYALIDPAGAVAAGLFSAGEQVYYFLNAATGEIEGRAGVSAEAADRVVFTVSVNGAGQLVFNLDDKLDHDHLGATDHSLAITDLGQYVQVVATSTSGLTAVDTFDGLLTVNVVDDIPVAGTAEDVVVGNHGEASATGAIDVHFGADGAAVANALQLLAQDGSSLIGASVVANDGTPLTVNGEALVYTDDGDGGVVAVDAEGHVVFSVDVNLADHSYTVTMLNEIDGVSKSADLFDSTGSGIAHEDATFNVTADLLVKVTAMARDATGKVTEAASVQWDDDGVGVNGVATVGADHINVGDSLHCEFTDASGNSQTVEGASFTLTDLAGHYERTGKFIPETASYTLYNGDDAVGTYTVNGEEDGTVTFITPDGLSFDSIVFTVGDKSSAYQVQSVSVEVEPTITYAVQVTDGDGDTTIATDTTFDVTFSAEEAGDDPVYTLASSSAADDTSSFVDTTSDGGSVDASLDHLLDQHSTPT